MKKETKELFNLKRILFVLIGNTIYALGIAAFVLPAGLMTGGTTGLGLFLQHALNIPLTVTVAVFNIAMFILALLFLGKTFALTAVISTFYFPFILEELQQIEALKQVSDDKILCVVMAGLMIGFGVGFVIKAGASTGGVDIPPLILNKKFGVSVSKGLYAIDMLMLLLQLIFSSLEMVLYGILLILLYTTILDKVLLSGKSQIEVKIVSEKYEEINRMIQTRIDRGTTLLKIQSGYLKKDSFAVLTVLSNREFPKLNQFVLEIDPNAFMTVSQVNEVMGRGFTLNKIAEG